MMASLGTEREELIRSLQLCATASEHCATTAIGMADTEKCIQTCRDAASLCRVAAELAARQSEYEMWVVPASVLAAQACANQCDLHLGVFFTECAAACRAVVAAADNIADGEPVQPNAFGH